MKRTIQILSVLCLAAAVLTGCGSRMRSDSTEQRNSDVTVIHTTPAPDSRNDAADDARELVSDAARNASEAASNAIEHGKDIVTDVARDASEAVADRKGKGEHDADDDGKVRN